MQRHVLLIGCWAVIGPWFGSRVLAENPQVPPLVETQAASELEQAERIEQLASSEFTVRRAAFMELWRSGRRALPLIAEAKSAGDRQVAEAAKILAILVELDIAPGESGESARLLELLTDPTPPAIVQLCEAKHWDVAERLVRQDSVLTQKFQEPYGRFLLGRLVEAALVQGDPRLAWPIIRHVTPTALAMWIAHKTSLPAEAMHASDDYANAWQLFYSQDIEAALRLGLPPLIQVPMITRSARWSRLLDPPIQLAICGEGQTPAQTAVKAVLTEVAGDLPKSLSIWQELLQPRGEVNSEIEGDQDFDLDPRTLAALQILRRMNASGRGGQSLVNQFIAALTFCGRTEPVELYLMEQDRSAACGFYLAGNNHAKALEALGLHADLSNLESWLRQRKALISVEFGRRPPDIDHFDETARLCATLSGLGFAQEARRVLDELVSLARTSRGSQEDLWSRSLLGWLGRSEARALVIDVARTEFAGMTTDCQAAVLRDLFGSAGVALWTTAPGENSEMKWENLEQLRLWDRGRFGPAAQSKVSSWLRRAVEHLASQQVSADQLSSLAETAIGYGDSDLALEILSVDVSAKDSSMANIQWLDAAKIHIQRGQPEQAAALLKELRQSSTASTSGVAIQHNVYATEIEAMLLCGRFDQARQLEQARWLRPLATTRFYQGANYLQSVRQFIDDKQFEKAAEYAEPAFLLADSGGMDVYWAASEYAEILSEFGDYARQADVQTAALVEALQPYAGATQYLIGNAYYSSLRFAAQKEKLSRAVACIESGDLAGARHSIEVGRQLQPQDIEMVVQCFPRLQAAGETELADELFESYEANMLNQIAQWPRDATALNNLAWMYAQCNRKLDEAMQLVRSAVELAPHSAVFLDTLAEVEYRSGLVEQALETMRGCVRLDPREQHYRQNLIRFRSGDE